MTLRALFVGLLAVAGVWKILSDQVEEAEDRMRAAAATATETASELNKIAAPRALEKYRASLTR